MKKSKPDTGNNASRFREQLLLQQTESIARTGIWEFDLPSQSLYWSDGVFLILGYEPQSFVVDTQKGLEVIHPDDRDSVAAYMSKAIETGRDYSIKSRFVAADGSIKHIRSMGRVIKDAANNPIKLIGVFQDITDIIEANEKLVKVSSLVEELVTTIDGIIWEADATTFEFEYISSQVEKILGFTPEEWLSEPKFWEDHIHPDDRSEAIGYCHSQTLLGNDHFFEYRMLSKNGEYKWFQDRVTVVAENGKPVRLRGLLVDITQEKIISDKLLQEKNLNAGLIQHLPNIFFLMNEKREFLMWNEMLERTTGYRYEEVENKQLTAFFNPSDQQLIIDQIKIAFEEAYTQFEAALVTKSENQIPYIFTVAKIDYRGQNCVYGIGVDVSRKQLKEEQLIFSEQRFKSLVQEGSDLIAILDREGSYKYVSPTSLSILGVAPEEFIGKNAFAFIHPEDKDMVMADFLRLDTEKRVTTKPFRFQHVDGSWRWVETVVTNMTDDPAVGGIVANSRDVTSRILSESIIQESELKYRSLFNNSPLPKIIYDLETFQIYDVNDTAVNYYGYSREEFLNMTMLDLRPEEEIAKFRKAHANMDKGSGTLKFGTFTHIKKNREQMQMDVVAHELRFHGRECMLAAYNDVTEKIKIQNEVAQSEKRFKALVQEGTSLITILNADATIHYISPNHSQHIGFTADELTGRNAFEFVHPDDYPVLKEIFSTIPDERIKLPHFRFKHKTEGWRWVQGTVTNLMDDESVKGFLINSNDITDLVEMQEQLKLSEQKISLSEKRFKALVQEGSDLISILDAQGVYQYTSPNNKLYLGYNENEMIGKKAVDFIHPSDKDLMLKEFDNLKTDKRVKISPYRFMHKSDGWRWLQSTGTNLTDDETVNGFVINSVDITDLVEMRDAIKNSNERFELVMQAGSESIWDFNPLTGEMYLGIGFERNFGIVPKSLKKNQKNFNRFLHPDEKSEILNDFRTALDNPEQTTWEREYRLRKADDEYAFVRDRSVILRDDHGIANRVVGAIQDITSAHFNQQLETIEKNVMEFSIQTDATLEKVLSQYLLDLEGLFPGMKASILQVKGNKLYNLASPSLPNAYIKEIEGTPITANSGSCGSAAFRKQKVVVSDIYHDTRWSGHKALGEDFGFTACWAQPIFNSKGEVTATFAVYYNTVRFPNTMEEHAFDRSQSLISILLSKFEYLHDIQKSNERYEYVNKATKDAIYEWDIDDDLYYWGESFNRIFGHNYTGKVFDLQEWVNLMHPYDAEFNKAEWDDFITNKEKNRWNKEFRFKKADGTYAFVEEVGHLIRDEHGIAKRMIGVLRDISQTKLAELQKKLQSQVSLFFKKESRLDQILSDVLQFITEYVDLNAAEIWFKSINNNHLNLIATYPKDRAAALYFEKSKNIKQLSFGEGLAGSIWKSRKAEFWGDIDTNKTFLRNKEAKMAGQKAAFGLPLFHYGNILGVLVLSTNKKDGFDLNNIEILKALENYLGAEIKRKQQEEEMYLLFQSAPEILAIASQEGYFVKVNPSFCSILGYSEEELTSQPFQNFVHPDDLERTITEYKETITGERHAENFINRYKTKSGAYRYIAWNSSDAFGEEGFVFSYGRDVTDIIDLQNLLENATKLSRVGAWEFDLLKKKQYWSSMAKAIHEVPENYEPDANTLLGFYKEGYSRTLISRKIDDAMSFGTPWDVELEITTAKGNTRWVRNIGNTEFIDGKCTRLYGSFQDIHEQKTAKLELEKSFTERNTILESIGDAFFTLDKNWIVTYWNKQAEILLGNQREDVVGRNLWDVFPGAVELESYVQYNKAVDTGENVHFDDYYPVTNQWFEVSAYPSQYGLSVYFKDVSIRKEAEEAIRQTNERFEKVTEATNDAIWDWDIENDTLYRSHNFDKLFGIDAAKRISSNEFWKNYFDPKDTQNIINNINKAIYNKKTTHWEMEYGIIRNNGSYAYVMDRGIIIRDAKGKAVRMIGAMTDITYRKEHEDSLKKFNIQLEQQARELAISNKELEQFAYVASHDLQEPLRMVSSFLSQLEKKYDSVLDEKGKQYIHFAVDGAKRMRAIILDILEFSRVGKYDEKAEIVDLNEVVAEACLLQQKTIEEKQAKVDYSDLPSIFCCRAPMQQVFQNLIGNALKYCRADVKPHVQITASDKEAYWQFAVKDNGIGIQKEYQDKIFIIFQRLHTKEDFSGTGMGLAIVKKIIENFGGNIWVESEVDKGSTFYFIIPKKL